MNDLATTCLCGTGDVLGPHRVDVQGSCFVLLAAIHIGDCRTVDGEIIGAMLGVPSVNGIGIANVEHLVIDIVDLGVSVLFGDGTDLGLHRSQAAPQFVSELAMLARDQNLHLLLTALCIELVFAHALEVLAVIAFAVLGCRLDELFAIDPTVAIGNFLDHAHRNALGLLDRTHEVRRLEQRLHRARVEPGIAPAEHFDIKRAVIEIHLVEIGDLKLSTRRRLDLLGKLAHTLVVEVEARDRIVALGMLWLLLDGDRVVVLIEFHDAKALGIIDIVAKDRGALAVLGTFNGAPELIAKAIAVEDVIAEDEGAGLPRAELLADDECLGKAIGDGCTL